jgi:flagellar hook-length control protein FliK
MVVVSNSMATVSQGGTSEPEPASESKSALGRGARSLLPAFAQALQDSLHRAPNALPDTATSSAGSDPRQTLPPGHKGPSSHTRVPAKTGLPPTSTVTVGAPLALPWPAGAVILPTPVPGSTGSAPAGANQGDLGSNVSGTAFLQNSLPTDAGDSATAEATGSARGRGKTSGITAGPGAAGTPAGTWPPPPSTFLLASPYPVTGAIPAAHDAAGAEPPVTGKPGKSLSENSTPATPGREPSPTLDMRGSRVTATPRETLSFAALGQGAGTEPNDPAAEGSALGPREARRSDPAAALRSTLPAVASTLPQFSAIQVGGARPDLGDDAGSGREGATPGSSVSETAAASTTEAARGASSAHPAPQVRGGIPVPAGSAQDRSSASAMGNAAERLRIALQSSAAGSSESRTPDPAAATPNGEAENGTDALVGSAAPSTLPDTPAPPTESSSAEGESDLATSGPEHKAKAAALVAEGTFGAQDRKGEPSAEQAGPSQTQADSTPQASLRVPLAAGSTGAAAAVNPTTPLVHTWSSLDSGGALHGAAAGALASPQTTTRDAAERGRGPDAQELSPGLQAWNGGEPARANAAQNAPLSVQTTIPAEIHIALQDEALGNVQIHTHVDGDQVGAAIAVEHHDVHALLASDLPALHQAFNDRQLRLDNVTLFHGSLPSGGGAGQGSARGQAEGQASPGSFRGGGAAAPLMGTDKRSPVAETSEIHAAWDSLGRFSVRA